MTTATLQPPTRTDEQRLAALEKANEVRTRRKVLRQRVERGDLHALRLLTDPDYVRRALEPADVEVLLTTEMRVFLRWPRGLGPAKRDRIFGLTHIPLGRRIGKLSARNRHDLARLIPAGLIAKWDDRAGIADELRGIA